MKPIKALVSLIPGGAKIYEKYRSRRKARRLARLGGTEDRFTHFYRTNKWRNKESVSGSGSTEEYTRNLRRELPGVIERFGVCSILDAPCGDFNWFRLVEGGKDLNYVGGDIVTPLVEENQRLYGDNTTRFVHLNIVNDELPECDLWMCRDCLFHLSHDDIFGAINNFLRSKIRYLLTSTYSQSPENKDIPTGAFRMLNLELPPFGLCKPILYIDDWIEGYPVRHLALWERTQVLDSVRSSGWYRAP